MTRDLDVLCADFVRWLDDLPAALVREFDCRVLADGPTTTIAPTGSGAAPLRITRTAHDGGGIVAEFGFGRAFDHLVPDCMCDACDGDSSEFIDECSRLVDTVTGGFREFRRPHRPRRFRDRFDRLDGGPWLEIGYESSVGAASSASADIVGEQFDITWQPWPRRSVCGRSVPDGLVSLDPSSRSYYDEFVKRVVQGKEIDEATVDEWVAEAEVGYDVEELGRRWGRVPRGSEAAQVVPVRLTAEELEAVMARAKREGLNRSEAIRAALDAWSHVA